MKCPTTLLAALLTGLLAATAVQAGPFLFLEQLLGSVEQSQAQPAQQTQKPQASSAGDVVIYMKVRAGVEKKSRNSKIIRRQGAKR